MTKKDTLIQFIAVLRAIEKGEVKITGFKPPSMSKDSFHECFNTSDGWSFSIFDDNGDWDYLHSITTPPVQLQGGPGRLYFDYDDIHLFDTKLDEEADNARVCLANYLPPKHVWEKVYLPIIQARYKK